jgi:succinate-acetate transporter protein
MRAQDSFGLIAFAAFGLWWVLFPKSVISFYRRFHRGKISSPKPVAIRVVGALWVALVLAMILYRAR